MQTKTFFLFSKNLIFNFLLLLFSTASHAQTVSSAKSVFDYLTPQEGAGITLELDLTELINSKNTNQYFPGALTAPDGKMLKLEVRPRGKFRRRLCEIPPLKLKFSKKGLRAAGLDTLNEVKLVVPCFDEPRGQELVLREYIAYRMFERLSPQSVRARLVKVTFRDKHVEQVKSPVYCLLVEHEEQLAVRLKGQIVEKYELPADSLQADQAALMAVFQCMIGNTDWGIDDIRNVYFLRPDKSDKISLIPHDFDFAGLVNAAYATPKAEFGLKNVRERHLMSDKISKTALRKASETVKNAQADLLALCNSAFLSKNSVKELTRYIESFFQNVDNFTNISDSGGKGNLR